MRSWVLWIITPLLGASFAAWGHADVLTLDHYQKPDGALVLLTDGNYVEPYFATKALIVAMDSGLDVTQLAQAWVEWVLAHQRHGKFERYCMKNSAWHGCGPADADDAMLALWLQLLYRLAPDTGIPSEWTETVRKSESDLARLWNGRWGVYHVSRSNHVGLFMDNVEVYAALRDIAAAQARFGQSQAASETQAKAERLSEGIKRIFWDKKRQRFRTSTQKNPPAFYPDVVAQLYPLLAGGLDGDQDPHATWLRWKQQFAPAWLDNSSDPHPWGLIAVAALKAGDPETAACWQARSEHLRYSTRWNILEEAAFQVVRTELDENRSSHNVVACAEEPAAR